LVAPGAIEPGILGNDQATCADDGYGPHARNKWQSPGPFTRADRIDVEVVICGAVFVYSRIDEEVAFLREELHRKRRILAQFNRL
jgi:hypothetical protein